MERIVDLVCENKLSELREATSARLLSRAQVILESHKKKLASEKKHVLKATKIADDPRKHSKGFQVKDVSNPTLMVRAAHRYGYIHECTNVEPGGKRHTFIHQNGHKLDIHTGGKTAFWSHSLNEGAGVCHLGNGEDPKDLLRHLEAIHGSFDHNAYIKSRANQLKENYKEEIYPFLTQLAEGAFSKRPIELFKVPPKAPKAAPEKPNTDVHQFSTLTDKEKSTQHLVNDMTHPHVNHLVNNGYKFSKMVDHVSGGIGHKYTNGSSSAVVGPFHHSDYITHNVAIPANHKNHPMHNTLAGFGYQHTETRTAGRGQFEHRYASTHPNLPHMSLITRNANHTYAAYGKDSAHHEPLHEYLGKKTKSFGDTDHHIIGKAIEGHATPVAHPRPVGAPEPEAPVHNDAPTHVNKPALRRRGSPQGNPIVAPLKRV